MRACLGSRAFPPPFQESDRLRGCSFASSFALMEGDVATVRGLLSTTPARMSIPAIYDDPESVDGSVSKL